MHQGAPCWCGFQEQPVSIVSHIRNKALRLDLDPARTVRRRRVGELVERVADSLSGLDSRHSCYLVSSCVSYLVSSSVRPWHFRFRLLRVARFDETLILVTVVPRVSRHTPAHRHYVLDREWRSRTRRAGAAPSPMFGWFLSESGKSRTANRACGPGREWRLSPRGMPRGLWASRERAHDGAETH